MTPETNTVAAVLKGADADAAADALLANVPVTKLPMTAAAKRATSPVAVTKATKKVTAAVRARDDAKRADAKPADASPKAVKKVTVAKPDAKPAKPAAKPKGTFTSVDLAAEKGINAKTLRARIRRNIAKWEPLFAGEKHTFKDNVTTRKAIDALLAAAE